MNDRLVERVVSGGQTGVDRAALGVAVALGIQHGGWCPLGRRAEDGVIPSEYELQETPSREYRVRTERNVVDSDATFIVYRHRLAGGSALTRKLADRHRRPYFLHDLGANSDPQAVQAWLRENQFQTLNVAGPRESSAPGIQPQAFDFLMRVFGDARSG